jgi:hypothetical protein
MTSRGIGDVQRVLGQPQSWIDQHFTRPEPPLPDANGDPLIAFVNHYVATWENQVATEAREYSTGPHGAAFLRWAHDIRRQCAALRRVLARYGEARDTGSPQVPLMREQIRDLATAWNNVRDWPDDWT